MESGFLESGFDRVEGVQREVDCEAGDCAGLGVHTERESWNQQDSSGG